MFPLVYLVLYENLLAFLDLNLGKPIFSLKNFLYAVSKSLSDDCRDIESTSFSHTNSFFKLVKSELHCLYE